MSELSRRLGARRPPRQRTGTLCESSPPLVRWDCSPLQVVCTPGAGGNGPAGSSKMQDWAQPPAGRWARGGAPEAVLLVGTRGTERGTAVRPPAGAEARLGDGGPGLTPVCAASLNYHLQAYTGVCDTQQQPIHVS